MRISSVLVSALAVGLLLGAEPSIGFDGNSPSNNLSPLEAFRSGAQALKVGETDKAITSLQYAAENGHALAQWKLGRMYADGDGVELNKARAYDYFRRLTTMRGDDSAGTPNARYLANAFVTLGLYHLEGIPGTLKANPNVAREMFRYAAAYFADPEAQYPPHASGGCARWRTPTACEG